jgi:hypothetical protein
MKQIQDKELQKENSKDVNLTFFGLGKRRYSDKVL